MNTPSKFDRYELLQEAVSCARATLRAIERGGFFSNPPADEANRADHGHGSWLLAMLDDKLEDLQAQVDAKSEDVA